MGISQENLSQGICTPSYLSRIENNRLIADNQIYKLLFEKLGMDYEDIIGNNTKLNERLENWYKNMLLHKKSNENIDELRELTSAANKELSIKFDIIYCYHLLLTDNINQAGRIITSLKMILKASCTRNYFLYTNVMILYYYKKKMFSYAVDIGLTLTKVTDYKTLGKDYELGVFFYNLAINYKSLYLYEKSAFLAEQALSIFKDHYYLKFSLDCHILLGVCYNNLLKYEKALKFLFTGIRILDYFPNEMHTKYLGVINNNIGYCYECQNKYNDAVHYYQQSLYHKKDSEKMITLINIIRSLYIQGKIDAAKYWLSIAQDLKSENTSNIYIIQIEIFSLVLLNENPSIEDIIRLQKSSINFFKSNKLWVLTKFYSISFAKLYKKNNHYKKASNMYELALEANEKLLKGGYEK